jgi:predicted lipoprotein with Yx(FWY)xxD motif
MSDRREPDTAAIVCRLAASNRGARRTHAVAELSDAGETDKWLTAMARDPAGPDLAAGPPPQAATGRSAAERWLGDRRWLPAVLVLAVAVVVGALLALSLSGSSTNTNAPGPAVRVGQSSLGKILINSSGLTFYMYTHDKRGLSACTEACARVWPPAIAAGTPTAAAGVSRAKLTTIKRSDHRTQLAYNGHPLYTFSEDTRKGQAGGEGFLGAWFMLSPAGRPVKKPGSVAPSSGY